MQGLYDGQVILLNTGSKVHDEKHKTEKQSTRDKASPCPVPLPILPLCPS